MLILFNLFSNIYGLFVSVNHIYCTPHSHLRVVSENPKETRPTRQVTSDTEDNQENYNSVDYDFNNRPTFLERLFKRSLAMKRNVSKEDKTPVKIVDGSAIIPKEAGVKSIGIPPLLTLNNNLSEIPVPIPNTSVVHYSKINTLVRTL